MQGLTISALPRGLLGQLGIQSFGENPREMSPILVPTLELGDLYRLNTMEVGVGDDAAPALGSRTFTASTAGFLDLSVAVPANEVWYLHEFHLTASPGAATAITLQPRLSANNVSMVYAMPQVVTGIAGAPPVHIPFGRSGFWLPPLSKFGYLCSSITGAPGTVSGVAWVSRYKA